MLITSGTKQCSKCHEHKSITDFYIRKNTDKPYSYCKACTYTHCSKSSKDRVSSPNKHIARVANYLMKLGMPVLTGKRDYDLLVFGCLTVEVKQAMEYYPKPPDADVWRVSFTPNQLTKAMDIIAIITLNDDILFVDGYNPKWFKPDGSRFQGKIFDASSDEPYKFNVEDVLDIGTLVRDKMQLRCAEIQMGTFNLFTQPVV